MNIYVLFSWIQLLLCLLNSIVGLRSLYKVKLFEDPIHYIFIYCLLDLITSIVLRYFNETNYFPRGYIYIDIVFITGELLILPKFITTLLEEKHNWSIPIILAVVPVLISSYYLPTESAISIAISGLYITFFCLKFLLEIIKKDNKNNILKSKYFWAVIGIMVCYTASLPSCLGFMFLNFAGNSEVHLNIADFMRFYFTILNVSMHCIFFKVFIWKKEPQSSYFFR